MTEKVVYNDPTPNHFPDDYDDSQVDSRVKIRSKSIAHKDFGVHVREALMQGIEIGSVVANEAKNIANDTANRQDESERIVQNTSDNVNNVLSNITDNAGDSAAPEVIAARKNDDQPPFNSLSERLKDIEKIGFTEMYFPRLKDYQEDICLLYLANKWILIDTGDANDWVNLKNFILEHTDKLDIAIISHYHPDHIGNIVNILSDADISTDVMTWYMPAVVNGMGDAANDIISAIEATNNSLITVDTDLFVRLDSRTTIQFMNGSAESISHYQSINVTDWNEFSLVALIQYNATKMFFAGDIRNNAIDWMLEHYDDFLSPVDFLKINHHGFDFGNNPRFFVKLRPKNAIAMLIKKNYLTSTSSSRGIDSTALNVLNAVGTTTSLAFESEISYKITQNNVTTIEARSNLRGTTKPAPVVYYVKTDDVIPEVTNGTEEHPFWSIDEALSYVQNAANVEYFIRIMSGNYGDVEISDVHNYIQLTLSEGVTFKSLKITACPNVEVVGDVHTTTTSDRAIVVDRSTVVFDNTLINDDTTADLSGLTKSRFLTAYMSKVHINTINCNKRSTVVAVYNSAEVSVDTMKGAGNLYGMYASLGSIKAYNSSELTATTQILEQFGRVEAGVPWTTLPVASGFSNQGSPAQYLIKHNHVYVRGNILNNSWPVGTWATVATFPSNLVSSSVYNYRFAGSTTNDAAITISVENSSIKVYATSQPNLVSLAFDFEL